MKGKENPLNLEEKQMNLYEYRKQLALDGYTEEARSLLYLLQIEGWNESEKITQELISEGKLPKER